MWMKSSQKERRNTWGGWHYGVVGIDTNYLGHMTKSLRSGYVAELSCPSLELFLDYCVSSWLAEKVLPVHSDSQFEDFIKELEQGQWIHGGFSGPQVSSNFSELETALAGVSMCDLGDVWSKREPMWLLGTSDPNGTWVLCASLSLLQFSTPPGKFSY